MVLFAGADAHIRPIISGRCGRWLLLFWIETFIETVFDNKERTV